MKKTILLCLMAMAFGLGSFAQPISGTLKEGSDSPDFKLQVRLGGRGVPQTRDLSSYRGRWLVLDFWTRYCITCIQGFPKLQQLRDSLSAKMDFLLVGRNDERHNSGIAELYRRIASEEKLSLDIAFDTLAFERFGVTITPHVVVISPEGRIARIGRGDILSLEKLQALIDGSGSTLAAVAPADPLIGKRYGDSQRESRLDARSPQAHLGADQIAKRLKRGKFETLRSNLESLYLLAYFGRAHWNSRDSLYGKSWPKPLLQLGDSSAFVSDFDSGKGYYAYHLQLRDTTATEGTAMAAMREDLLHWTGLRAKMETREIPVWELRTASSATKRKLRSRSAASSRELDHSLLVLKKGKMLQVMNILQRYHPSMITIDATGITGDIDLELRASFASLPSLQRALEAVGLRLVKTTRPMSVLVISGK